MKIAIPVAENRLCLHFGHCESFVLIDADPEQKEILNKTTLPAPPHQPGLLPQWLHEQGAEVIISGGMGMRAQQLFASKNIKVVTGASSDDPDTIARNYLNDALLLGENVCDH
ncbi:MAG: ATPase [Candidatus Omnitrophota bacterium]|jgi:predicted Fe-Mo cluster-binding NifX family protein|nr:MAG: ATPase [Candidatus Omnitrophota bacterium]